MIYIDAFFMLIPTSISTWAKGLFRSIEFYKHKMMAVDRCPLLPIDLDSDAKHQIILKYFFGRFEGGFVWRWWYIFAFEKGLPGVGREFMTPFLLYLLHCSFEVGLQSCWLQR